MLNPFHRLRCGRKSKAGIAAAVAAAAATTTATATDRGLIVDVRALLLNGQPLTGVDGPKHVQSISGPGDVVTLAVFARVTGTNGVNDEFITSAAGQMVSSGSLLGNLNGSVVAPFNQSGFQNGSNVDLDGDTDLDVGAPLGSTGTAALGYFQARGGASPTPTPTTPVDANTGEVQIGQFTFTVGAPSGTDTLVNWVRRSTATGGNQVTAALWFEDGTGNPNNSSSNPYGSGTPVLIGGIPEPSTAALAGIAALGLLARRRRGGGS